MMGERIGLPTVQSAHCEWHEAMLERRGRRGKHNLLAARVMVQVSIFGRARRPCRITDIQVLLLLGFCGSAWAAAAASAS